VLALTLALMNQSNFKLPQIVNAINSCASIQFPSTAIATPTSEAESHPQISPPTPAIPTIFVTGISDDTRLALPAFPPYKEITYVSSPLPQSSFLFLLYRADTRFDWKDFTAKVNWSTYLDNSNNRACLLLLYNKNTTLPTMSELKSNLRSVIVAKTKMVLGEEGNYTVLENPEALKEDIRKLTTLKG